MLSSASSRVRPWLAQPGNSGHSATRYPSSRRCPEWFGTGAKLRFIVGVRLVATVIGNVYVWGGAPFYDIYEAGDEYLGLSRSGDQSLAGSLMMLEGSLVTMVAIAWLFLRMAQEGEIRQQLLESGVDPRVVRRAVRYRRWRELQGG